MCFPNFLRSPSRHIRNAHKPIKKMDSPTATWWDSSWLVTVKDGPCPVSRAATRPLSARPDSGLFSWRYQQCSL